MRTALLVGRRSYVPVLPETDTRSCLKLAWSPTGHSRRKVTLWHGFSNAAERGWAGSVAAVAVAEVIQRADPAVLWLEAPLVLLEARLLEPRLRRCSPGRRVSLDAGDDRVVMVRRRTPVVGCGDADSICRREREPWVRRPGGPNWHASVGSIHGSRRELRGRWTCPRELRGARTCRGHRKVRQPHGWHHITDRPTRSIVLGGSERSGDSGIRLALRGGKELTIKTTIKTLETRP